MLFDKDKFILESVSGFTETTDEKKVSAGLFGRGHKIVEIPVSKAFSLEKIESSTDIPDKSRCGSYSWLYNGTFHLQKGYVYLAHDRYATVQEFTCFSLHLIDHKCVDVNTRFISLHINPNIETPQAEIKFSERKEPHTSEWQGLHGIRLIFQSKAQIADYISSLEPADHIMVTKLSKNDG